MRSAIFSALAAAVLVLTSAVAGAADPPPHVTVRLVYALGPGADEVCPAEVALHDEVARRMGYDPFRADGRLRLIVIVTRQDRGLSAAMSLYDEAGAQRGAKTFMSRTDACAVLVSGIAIETAASLEPIVLPQEPPHAAATPSPHQSPGSEPVPPPPIRAPPSPAPTPAPASLRGQLGLGPLIAFGSAPNVDGGVALFGGFRWPAISLAAEVRFDAPASLKAAAVPGGSIRSWMLGGSVMPCGHLGPVFGCALALFGSVQSAGQGVDVPQRDTSLYIGIGGRLGFEAPISPRFAVRLYGDALGAARTVHMILAGSEVWKTAPVSGDLGGALLAFF